jgi:aspartyl-tRNA(Asn)/glutamyl-tRNA(Gln) amidotransferase subunit C
LLGKVLGGGSEPKLLRRMLDRAQVLHVARLARLELDEDEVERMAAELSHVLGHVDRVRELDLTDVAPTSHAVDVAGVMRADEPQPCLDRDVILAAAPEPVDGGFGVPSPGPGEE